MDTDTEYLAKTIGTRIRHERQQRRWSLDFLAKTSGVSRRMLVNVEQGSVNPSVGTLLRLSDALGIGLPSLVEPPTSQRTRVTRAGTGAVLWTGPSGGQGVLLAGTAPPDVVELWDWHLMPGETHESEAHTDGTQELLQVLAGTISMVISGEKHRLETGDALTFTADVPHTYTNPGPDPARFCLSVYEPGVSGASRTS